MNWYKKSKLIDKDPSKESVINTTCSYCHRWATHPFDEHSDNIAWKKFEDLDEDEKEMASFISKQPFSKELGLSHGICPYCNDILIKYDYNIDPSKVGEMSLESI